MQYCDYDYEVYFDGAEKTVFNNLEIPDCVFNDGYTLLFASKLYCSENAWCFDQQQQFQWDYVKSFSIYVKRKSSIT